MDFVISAGRPCDAIYLGLCVARAIGPELCTDLAGSTEKAAEVFAELASREDTQYSYRNAMVARDKDGIPVGACVAYDGAKLPSLRIPAFELFKHRFGFDITAGGDETAPGEFYLDTLAVNPDCRRQGIATALINATAAKAKEAKLPVGLLVDPDNNLARGLYSRYGFEVVDQRLFAGTTMDHMLLSTS